MSADRFPARCAHCAYPFRPDDGPDERLCPDCADRAVWAEPCPDCGRIPSPRHPCRPEARADAQRWSTT